MDPNLPAFLQIKDTNNQGKGMFTNKLIHCGERFFTDMPYAFEVIGATPEDMRMLCHHCLEMVPPGSGIVCNNCNVIGYCSSECCGSAALLHALECKGIAELEKFRETGIKRTKFWPPKRVLTIARAINKRILRKDGKDDAWITHLARHSVSPFKEMLFPLVKSCVRLLVPKSVSDSEIYQMFCVEVHNGANMYISSTREAAGFYFEYSLVNHKCRPNCEFKNEKSIAALYALQDIEPGSQLSISYLQSYISINVREIRREALKSLFGFGCNCDVCLEEQVVGSQYWLLDKQKRSLIAPWSRDKADTVMKDGWESIQKSMDAHSYTKPQQAIDMLESALKVQKDILDPSNVTLIITRWGLLKNYSLLSKHKEALSHLNSLGTVGIKALCQYGTTREIVEIGNILLGSCVEFGLWDKATKLSELMLCVSPKALSSFMSPITTMRIRKENNISEPRNKRGEIDIQNLSAYIMQVCDYASNSIMHGPPM